MRFDFLTELPGAMLLSCPLNHFYEQKRLLSVLAQHRDSAAARVDVGIDGRLNEILKNTGACSRSDAVLFFAASAPFPLAVAAPADFD